MGNPLSVAAKLALLGTVCLVAVVAIGWALSGNDGSNRNGSSIRPGVTLHVVSSYTSHRIENAYLPAIANGIYLIMDVTATNSAAHVVKLTGARVQLDVDGAKYPPDANGLSALELSGHGLLAGAQLEPAMTKNGWLVFDVPPAAIKASPKLCLDQAVAGAAVC